MAKVHRKEQHFLCFPAAFLLIFKIAKNPLQALLNLLLMPTSGQPVPLMPIELGRNHKNEKSSYFGWNVVNALFLIAFLMKYEWQKKEI